MTMIKIADVDEGSKPFSLEVTFSDGVKGEVDFSELIRTDSDFSVLDTHEKFIQFGLEYGTLVWSNDLDIATEWIRNHLK